MQIYFNSQFLNYLPGPGRWGTAMTAIKVVGRVRNSWLTVFLWLHELSEVQFSWGVDDSEQNNNIRSCLDNLFSFLFCVYDTVSKSFFVLFYFFKDFSQWQNHQCKEYEIILGTLVNVAKLFFGKIIFSSCTKSAWDGYVFMTSEFNPS